MERPREYTEEEVREKFLNLVWSYVRYWEKQPDLTCRERLEGLAFGMLVILDGESASMPSFIVAPLPHPDDKAFHKDNGDNWYPENHTTQVTCDISGCLHELFHKANQEKGDENDQVHN